MSKKRANRKPIFFALVAAVVLIVGLVALYNVVTKSPDLIINPVVTGTTHEHAHFEVYINGFREDFQRTEYNEVDPRIHLHVFNPDGGETIHKEAVGATLGMFFSSLGIEFNRECIGFGPQRRFCSQGDRSVRLYVNAEERQEFDMYEPLDGDEIVIIYGIHTLEDIERINRQATGQSVYS